jgi:lysozyme family protein
MNSLLSTIIRHTISLEGGSVNNPNDAGGETKFGISKRSYPALDIKNLTEEQAIEIYERDFWKKMNLNLLCSPVVAGKVFDIGVNMGQSTAIRFLQQIVGAGVDGILGAKTAALVNVENEQLIINGLRKKQMLKYAEIVKKNPTQIVFLEGWINRAFA